MAAWITAHSRIYDREIIRARSPARPRGRRSSSRATSRRAHCALKLRKSEGKLCVERHGSSDLRFTHADGSLYGEVLEPSLLDTASKIFGALKNLGFAERDIRPVLAELRTHEQLRGAEPQSWLRAALQRLTKPTKR